MIRIAVNNLKPGMKLAKPVQNESGMVLISEGTELTFSTIERLIIMGVSSVMIEGEKTHSKSKEDVLNEINARFKKTENAKHMSSLKRILIDHINELYK